MRSKKRFVIPAVIATMTIVGCSSDSDDDNGGSSTTAGTTTAGTTTDGGTTAGTTTAGTTTAGTTTAGNTTDGMSNASFFNDDSGVDFANGLGGSLSQIFSSAFSAVPLLLGGVTPGDGEAPRLARASTVGSEPCFTDGSIDFTFVTSDVDDSPESASIVFNNCDEEGDLSTGGINIAFSGDFDSDNGTIAITFDDFSVSSEGEVANIDGDLSMGVSTVGDTTTVTIQGTALAMSTTGGVEDTSVSFNNFNLTGTTNDTNGDASMGGAANITVPEGSVQLSINPPLEVPGDADFPTSGVLSMTASDGSSQMIDAGTGNDDTYDYTINNQGVVTTGTANWSTSGIGGLDINI